MPKFCEYRMCHNLGSSSFGGYCNEAHQIRGERDERTQREEKETPTKDEAHKTQSLKTEMKKEKPLPPN